MKATDAAVDWIIGIFVVAALYLLVKPGSFASRVVVDGMETLQVMVLTIMGPQR